MQWNSPSHDSLLMKWISFFQKNGVENAPKCFYHTCPCYSIFRGTSRVSRPQWVARLRCYDSNSSFGEFSLLPQLVRGEKAVLMESYLEDRDLFHDCQSAPDKTLMTVLASCLRVTAATYHVVRAPSSVRGVKFLAYPRLYSEVYWLF